MTLTQVIRCAQFNFTCLWPVMSRHERGVKGESSTGHSPRSTRVIKMAATEYDWRKFVFADSLGVLFDENMANNDVEPTLKS